MAIQIRGPRFSNPLPRPTTTTKAPLTKSIQYDIRKSNALTKSLKYTTKAPVAITKSLAYVIRLDSLSKNISTRNLRPAIWKPGMAL